MSATSSTPWLLGPLQASAPRGQRTRRTDVTTMLTKLLHVIVSAPVKRAREPNHNLGYGCTGGQDRDQTEETPGVFKKATLVVKHHQAFNWRQLSAPFFRFPPVEIGPRPLPSVNVCVHYYQLRHHACRNYCLVRKLKPSSTTTVVLLVPTRLKSLWGGDVVQMTLSHIFMVMLQ